MSAAELILEMCKDRKIPISRLEKDLSFANGYVKGRVGGRIPADRTKAIAEYLHVHPSDLDPEMFSKEYANPKYDLILKRLAEDEVFEAFVMDLYAMSKEEIQALDDSMQTLYKQAKLIGKLPSIRYMGLQTEYTMPNAANDDVPGTTEEDKAHDDAIMNDKKEWE